MYKISFNDIIAEAVTDCRIRPHYIVLDIDWCMLDYNTQLLIKCIYGELRGHSVTEVMIDMIGDEDDNWSYAGIVVPYDGQGYNVEEAFLFVDDFIDIYEADEIIMEYLTVNRLERDTDTYRPMPDIIPINIAYNDMVSMMAV